MSGGSMAATLGHGRRDIVAAARRQAERLAYMHNERLTNPLQERLAEELVEVAPEGFTRVRFVTGGSEANELALKLARAYHVERGEPQRGRVVRGTQDAARAGPPRHGEGPRRRLRGDRRGAVQAACVRRRRAG